MKNFWSNIVYCFYETMRKSDSSDFETILDNILKTVQDYEAYVNVLLVEIGW